MMARIENWLFGTITGKVFLFSVVAPCGLVFWFLSSLAVGEDFFEWIESRSLRKAARTVICPGKPSSTLS